LLVYWLALLSRHLEEVHVPTLLHRLPFIHIFRFLTEHLSESLHESHKSQKVNESHVNQLSHDSHGLKSTGDLPESIDCYSNGLKVQLNNPIPYYFAFLEHLLYELYMPDDPTIAPTLSFPFGADFATIKKLCQVYRLLVWHRYPEILLCEPLLTTRILHGLFKTPLNELYASFNIFVHIFNFID
jgi:hypothetical protein